jgi:hypothetical protein
MKTTIYIAILVLSISSTCLSQSNLQFNQPITYSGFLGQGSSSPTWTVPAGKVWKVEHFSHDFLVVNNDRAGNGNSNSGPLWLKAGDQIRYDLAFYGANCCGTSTNFLISIIEFNLIP